MPAITNEARTRDFLARTDEATRDDVLRAIGRFYGWERSQVVREITARGALQLPEFLRGSLKTRVRAKMQIMGLAVHSPQTLERWEREPAAAERSRKRAEAAASREPERVEGPKPEAIARAHAMAKIRVQQREEYIAACEARGIALGAFR